MLNPNGKSRLKIPSRLGLAPGRFGDILSILPLIRPFGEVTHGQG